MKRLIITAASSCLIAGCLFSPSRTDDNATNSSLNNTPNNTANNTANNGTSTTNNVTVVLNNHTNEPPNNGTVPNPNNETVPDACPDVEPPPLCEASFTCSPNARVGCERCGLCEGVCAGLPRGPLGVCVQITPIISGADIAPEPSAGLGTAVAINDSAIYVSRPGFEGVGEVLVVTPRGELGPMRLRAPAGAGSLFGTALDASPAGVAVACRGCSISGQVYAFAVNFEAGTAVYPTTLLAGQQIGDAVAALRFDSQDIVLAGSPATSTVLLSRSGSTAAWGEFQNPLFGVDIDAQGDLAVVATGRNSFELRRYSPDGSSDITVTTDAVANSSLIAVRHGLVNAFVAVADATTLEVHHRGTGNWSVVDSDQSGMAQFVSLTFSDGLLFAALSNGEVRIYWVDRTALIPVGGLMIPGVTDLAAHGNTVVIGAGNADVDGTFAYVVQAKP